MAGDERRKKGGRSAADVKVDYRTVGSFITDYSANISKGGVFVKTSIPLPIGEKVRLRVTLPGHALPFGLEGVVRWTSIAKEGNPNEPGMGIEFTNFEGETKEKLQRFVESVEADEPDA